MIFIFGLIIILCIIYLYNEKFTIKDNFFNILSFNYSKYPNSYNPPIPTLLSNYDEIMNNINKQNEYKSDISLALSPIPTIKCNELKNKDDCNQYGCNWFGSYCSSVYPSYL